ncbi:MAG: alpha-L-fucosidase [Bacteroidales bacterium]|nr:alpha-L-fucosidase [Bacteroidales bacterium]
MKKYVCISIILSILILSLDAQQENSIPGLETNQEALKKWQDMRFGMFIHWGPVSLRGTEIGWSRGTHVPIQDYDNLYKEFNPLLFNASEWVKIAKEAGMKYIIITTKHHDGFSLWPTDVSDYDISSTPYGKDILRQLSDECRKQGIVFGTYYSILDWHHPDYTTRYGGDPRPVEGSDMNKYIDYMYHQLNELITEYQTEILWFDGEWEDSWNHEEGIKLYRYCREQNNNLLINNRVDKGRKGMQGMSKSGFAGDFGTPEQEIGNYNPGIPWESCITIGKQWAWKPNDQLKSVKQLIHTLVLTAGGGGNLLLNVGPMMDGRIEQRQADSLKEVGKWISKYGDSIYESKAGPFMPGKWNASTMKENIVYLQLLKWPDGSIRLPDLQGYRLKKVSLMNGVGLDFEKGKKEVLIELPDQAPNPYCSTLVLEYNKPLSGVNPIELK